PWHLLPPVTVPEDRRLAHVRGCSEFAADLMDRFPDWAEGLDSPRPPDGENLAAAIREHGLEAGLRRFRNRQMLRIVWRDLCGLATLGETFESLTRLAELSLQAALDEHRRRLEERHGQPRGTDGSPQSLFVIGLGKFGGRELNLSSDIDVLFCFPQGGACDGRQGLSNDQFFTRQARAVIASLADITGDGFCFRVDTRLRPFGDSGPLTSSLAALEQYYQREGRDWERYALIKARPVAGDVEAGGQLIEQLRPFVYRRYIDYSSVEALQEMHANVQEDARRTDRLDDIKRGPGGIREIEFLVQCFQILRGGREPRLQTPSLDCALAQIEALGLLDSAAVCEIRMDYAYLRLLENRIQALRDQQTHRLPSGEDRARIARAMYEDGVAELEAGLERTRRRVSDRFAAIFPARDTPATGHRWADLWRSLRASRQDPDTHPAVADNNPLALFVRRLDRVALSQRAHQRLDRFMPELLGRLDGRALDDDSLNRVLDLVLAVCRRSAYLVLLVQHPKALDRMLELFERSEWIADKVIRFPALLDELIDPLLGRHIPGPEDLARSVGRILEAAPGTEAVLEALNYLKLATALRIAVGQLQGEFDGEVARNALSGLADAVLGGVLEIARREIVERHGRFAGEPGDGSLAIIGYGSLGAGELGYESDLDIVFLFDTPGGAGGSPGGHRSADLQSDGARPLPPERYFARLAQRILSFLTVMTPSGRLYEVDTRLRPNGRAGSLVSSTGAFRDYQSNEAWTWELQALTRARFVAGAPAVAAGFNRIRQEVLCRQRTEAALAEELREMRQRMNREHSADEHLDVGRSPKHRPGGLIDIEFLAQLGVLSSARLYPRVIQATGTLAQLAELEAIGWLEKDDAAALAETMRRLRSGRMMQTLLRSGDSDAVDTARSASVTADRLGLEAEGAIV
ncbi:MAG: bifunctional [glutamate--ammonia ligase]-adenylyl-L-tyrosine phosphorylase/[glutamate--ammonia-ligase] adenylyltransferase, partial [Xanthomonadales bacterium]|nr:bifunctional [glutamate--ammonia ligase]-adenylyl-L-tyrosine phosphorylase/[glutamate--ammonia-ligase] adenylyltransferase [Xanthomonadales bacterium]